MANNQAEVHEITPILDQIFQALNIKTFVYIDDVFAFNDLEVEKAIGWFAEAKESNLEEVRALLELNYSVLDQEIWKRQFRQEWNKLDSETKVDLINQLKIYLNSQLSIDTEVTSQIREILPDQLDYLELSPSSWQDRKKEILESLDKESMMLFLFDQDLKYDPGFSTEGTFSGGGLLKELVESQHKENVICGILSHRIGSTDGEIEFRKSFSAEYNVSGLDTNKYLPLSKSRLRDEKFLEFADGIKKLILNKFAEDLKIEAADILKRSHKEALDELMDLDVYALDLMVLSASRKSKVGAWEAETLVRIFQIFQQDSVRKLLFDPEQAARFNSLVDSARPISEIEIVQEDNIYPRVRKYRRQELYMSGNLIKYSPIQVGDIFKRVHSDGAIQDYILLAQPCDLTVRDDGNRARKTIALVPIVEEDNSRKSRRYTRSYWSDYWSTRTIIDNYYEDPEKIAVLKFKEVEWVYVDLLDLSVLNIEGNCLINLNNKNAPPNQLTLGWRILLDNLIENFSHHKERIDSLQKCIDAIGDDFQEDLEALKISVMPKMCFSDFLPATSYLDGIFDFKLKRVERYRQPGADSLLKLYMQYMARDAKDFDFSK